MPAQDTDLPAVQLAALLHDVGKLYQRSGLRHSAGYDAFTAADHGAHARWSADFVERHVAGRWPVSPHDVLTHHLQVPASRTARLVALADRMAAGEREEDAAGGPPPWESQLLSIFSRLSTEGAGASPPGYLPLAPLALERETLFPRAARGSAEECRRGYAELWAGFEREFAGLGQTGFEGYLEAVYHLLQRYCWCVPSAAYRSAPDVSLFDHSRLTCALAACLHLDGLDDADLERLLAWPPREAERDREILLLVGGDLSGLQEFLYTLAAKGAARTLRGRSFYLQLLAESAARFLLRHLGLGTPNALYWGGGHFYLLAPASARAELERAAADLEQAMLDLHRGELGLAVAFVPLSAADFERERFGKKWGEVGLRLGEAKGRRFGRVLRRSYDALFAPAGAGGTGARCQACHAEVPGSAGGEEVRCQDCEGMADLGRRLAEATREEGATLSLSRERPAGPASRWQEALGRAFGLWWDFDGGGPGALRYTLNRTDFVPAGAEGFRWVPAVIPWEDGHGRTGTKEFGRLAEDSRGIDRLGILRMDVDDLGSLFASGLGESATASRVAALSSSLRLFFEGWINRLCLEVQSEPGLLPGEGRRSDLLYGVYSGGDDLFVVGAWDLVPRLARQVRTDLESFAAGSPAVRISAGIAVVDSHLPLYQAAEEARKALEEGSKGHRRRAGRAKDAVTLLGQTLGWEEFEGVRDRVEELARLVGGPEQGRAARGLLSLLAGIHETYRRDAARQGVAEDGVPDRLYYGRWMWIATYGLARARERVNEDIRAALAAIENRLHEPAGIHRLGLVVRWAEYVTRSREVKRP